MPSEMSEHVCEENIEENYENFDLIESEIMKARAQPIPSNHQQQIMQQNNAKLLMEKFEEKFYNHESKVALNSDVDLIKTTKIPYAKQELTDDEKKSGNLRDYKINIKFLTNIEFLPHCQLFGQLVHGYPILKQIQNSCHHQQI